jgi:uncharacterized protein YegP (UPF0339 family)
MNKKVELIRNAIANLRTHVVCGGLNKRTGRFELKMSADGQYYFVLKSANYEVIAVSEMYTTKAAALNGIESIRNNAPVSETLEKY